LQKKNKRKTFLDRYHDEPEINDKKTGYLDDFAMRSEE
jgi:hypothetical protein